MVSVVRFYPVKTDFPPEAFGGSGPVTFADKGNGQFLITNGSLRVRRQQHMPGIGWWVLHCEDGPALYGSGPPRFFLEGQEIVVGLGDDSESAFSHALIRHKLRQARHG